MYQGFGETENEKKNELKNAIRSERYFLQSIAKKALPKEKVSMCLRMLPDKTSAVKIHQHQETHRAFYSGLLVCGRVWNCPVCAAKITERRRKELEHAFSVHRAYGGHIALLTLTFSHKKNDSLIDILNLFTKATESFFRGNQFDLLRKSMGMIGRVKALEVTYSDSNGFHPHTHIALFYENEIDLKIYEEKMYKLWKNSCKKQGLKVNRNHGLRLDNGEKANDYIAKFGKESVKWGIEQELTKAHVKKGRNGSMTPFDFLREYAESENTRYLFLFKEYSDVFKGKKQLHWSRGLKARFSIKELEDEQLAKEQQEQADFLGVLDYEFWTKGILRNDLRAFFLNMVEKYNFEVAKGIIERVTPGLKKENPSCLGHKKENR